MTYTTSVTSLRLGLGDKPVATALTTYWKSISNHIYFSTFFPRKYENQLLVKSVHTYRALHLLTTL